MFLIGLAFLFQWLLIQLFNIELVKSIIVTAIVFILIGLFLGERPFLKQQP